MHPSQEKNNTLPIRFQLVVDAGNVIISTSPEGKIRANITGLEYNQLEKIVECIEDAGSDAVKQFKKLVEEKL